MNKKFLSIIMLVSAVSLRGMDAEYEQAFAECEQEMSAEYTQKMSDSTAKAQAALSRAQARKDTLLNGLTAAQTKKACEDTGTWAVCGMTESGDRLPREDKDYDKYLQDTLKIVRGEDQSQGTFKCGTTGSNEK